MVRFAIQNVAWLTIVTAVAAGCRSHHSVTRGIKEPALMTQTISKHIPAGTTLDQAQRWMEREGFRCSRKSNSEFAALEGRRDYLYCDRSEGEMASVDRRWQVALVHRGGKIVDVSATTGLVGP
jgi:hypothetical protein